MPALWNSLSFLTNVLMCVFVRSLAQADAMRSTRARGSFAEAGIVQPGRCFSADSIFRRALPRQRSAGPRLCDAADTDDTDDLPRARQQLENVFSLSSAAAASSNAWRASVLERHAGVIADLPLWRVQWVALPGNLQILNVHVPHYVHMFNEVYKTTGRFGHLLLPGGSRSLGDPEYALQAGSAAPKVGVLMHVCSLTQHADGRLTVVAKALCRFNVLHATQESPYSRADVMLSPDTEERTCARALAARATATLLGSAFVSRSVAPPASAQERKANAERQRGGAQAGQPIDPVLKAKHEASAKLLGEVSHAAAAAAALVWAQEELRNTVIDGDADETVVLESDFLPLNLGLELAQTSDAADTAANDAADAFIQKRMRSAQSKRGAQPDTAVRGGGGGDGGGGDGGGGDGSVGGTDGGDDVIASGSSPPADDMSMLKEAGAALEQIESEITASDICLLEMEVELWRELITCLRLQQALRTGVQELEVVLPEQLLLLLASTPTPDGGWPAGAPSALPVPTAWLVDYPVRRRAQRLSFLMSSLLPDLDKQALLQAASTAARIKLVTEFLAEQKGRLAALVALSALDRTDKTEDDRTDGSEES